MIDPDPAPLVLRLGATPATKPIPAAQPEKQFHRLFDGFAKPATVEAAVQRLTATEIEMEQAIARWTEAFVDWTHLRAQAQPISAARPVGDGMMRYEHPMVFRSDGSVDRL